MAHRILGGLYHGTDGSHTELVLPSADYRRRRPVQLLWGQHGGLSTGRWERRVGRLWTRRVYGTGRLFSGWWALQPLPPLKTSTASVLNGPIPTTHFLLPRLRAKVSVLPGRRGVGLVENVVDPKKDLLPNSRAQLVWELYHLHDPA